MNITVYLKCDRNVELRKEEVLLKDLGEIRCINDHISAKLKAIRVHRFHENAPKRFVISSLRLIAMMEEVCPGIQVEVVGETDVLVEQVRVDKYRGIGQWAKVVLVCAVSFFGTAFTIMAYHNDVGIKDVFLLVYQLFMHDKPTGINPLEVSYSIGLTVGILLFFNHIGGRRITKDPTPIEVAMRNYEEDVDRALIATAAREGKEKEKP